MSPLVSTHLIKISPAFHWSGMSLQFGLIKLLRLVESQCSWCVSSSSWLDECNKGAFDCCISWACALVDGTFSFFKSNAE